MPDVCINGCGVRGGDSRIPEAPSVNGAMLLLALRASKPGGLINLQEIEV